MPKKKHKNSGVPSGGSTLPSNSSPMDVDLLERLVRLMTSNDLNTVDLRDGARRVVLKRGAVAQTGVPMAFSMMPPGASAPAAGHAQHSSASSQAAPSAADSDKDLIAIKSPMVGTFYSTSGPDAPPFVSVGSRVDEDTEVCIIEAMKVFSTIKAECRGTIEKILVTNGQTVEFGQVLFLVKPE